MSNESPANFSWLVKGELAGCGRPRNDLELNWLWNHGIRAIVCLNKEKPLSLETVRCHGFHYEFIPIEDYSAPSIDDMKRYIMFVKNMIAQRKPVATCCGAGIGRTGTMLAIYLVSQGYNPEEALKELRNKRQHGVETTEQKRAVWEYARYTRKET